MFYADTSQAYAYGFQDPASNWMVGIINLHESIMFYLIIIFGLVCTMLYSIIINTNHIKY